MKIPLLQILGICLAMGGGFLISPSLAEVEKANRKSTFNAQEQADRQKILESEHWHKTRENFKRWLTVQSAYDSQQLEEQEAQIQKHIATLTAKQLEQFLAAMDERLAVLLSPGMDQARAWVDHYYTKKAQHKIAKKLGVEDPLEMSGGQLESALQRFQDQRASEVQSSTAFNLSRQSEIKATDNYRKNQQAAQAKARSASRSAKFSSHAPVKTQKRPTRYPSGRYGFRRGWGGW